ASSLIKSGHEVQVVDAVGCRPLQFSPYTKIGKTQYFLQGLTYDEIVDRVDPESRLIALSCMFTPQWPAVVRLIEKLKAHYPEKWIVVGGEHGTALPEYSLKSSRVDFVAMGEGEETAIALANQFDRLQDKEILQNIAGIAYRLDGEIKVNPRRARKKQLDEIPWPAWDIFPIPAYLELNQPYGAPLGKSLPMLATRGCPYKCSFCSSDNMWTTLWKARNVEDLVNEIEMYKKKYGVTDVHFMDLTAVVNRKWTIQFADELLKRNMNITWQMPSGTRSESFDAEVIEKIYSAGCRVFSFAPETGSPRMLKIIRKQVNLEHLLSAASAAVKRGMSVMCNIIVGFPQEEWKDLFYTYWFILRCALHGVLEINLTAYIPLPGTEEYHKLMDQGRMPQPSESYCLSLFSGADIRTRRSWNERFSAWQVSCMVLGGFVLFYTVAYLARPWRFFKLFGHLFKRKATSKTERVLLG
ncbi:MAG: radical SAM protein, partial [bacterium]|nr:radical SAM protein [bacterium]